MSKKTAYKRRDGRWECRISMGKDENGRRVFRSFYGKSRDDEKPNEKWEEKEDKQ